MSELGNELKREKESSLLLLQLQKEPEKMLGLEPMTFVIAVKYFTMKNCYSYNTYGARDSVLAALPLNNHLPTPCPVGNN